MKFGVRQIANVVFKAKNEQTIGPYTFKPGQPVFYLDTAKTSSMEGAATTVYATGGRGNTRLIAWEGQKTLTLTVEDALLSPISFAMLSGAGLIKPGNSDSTKVHFHKTTTAVFDTNGVLDLTDALESDEGIDKTAPLYIMKLDEYGDITGELWTAGSGAGQGVETPAQGALPKKITITGGTGTVMVDYYVEKPAKTISEMQIDAGHFAGYYYVEADTLFRRQADGKDLPANLTFPNAKIQSNFTFSMAATGDPSTFSFTMDIFPGYTYFDRKKKVLCAIQVVDDASSTTETATTVFPHPAGMNITDSIYDSVAGASAGTETDVAGS